MTDSTVHAPLTAWAFLTGDPGSADRIEAIRSAIGNQGAAAVHAVHRFSSSVLPLLDGRLVAATERVLDQDLGGVLLSGWRKYFALIESAKRTLASPGTEEIVALLTHQVRSASHPHVDLYVDDALVHSFKFDLEIVFDLTGLAAVVSAGRLVTLRGGKCEITTTLRLERTEIAQRHDVADPDVLVELHPPVPLIDVATAAQTQLGGAAGRPPT